MPKLCNSENEIGFVISKNTKERNEGGYGTESERLSFLSLSGVQKEAKEIRYKCLLNITMLIVCNLFVTDVYQSNMISCIYAWDC